MTIAWRIPTPEFDRKVLLLVVASLLIVIPLISLTFTTMDPFASLKAFISTGGEHTPTAATGYSRNATTLSNRTEVGEAAAGPRVAVCLVGGARRFELTGPSILDRVVNALNNTDLFLHSPLDKNSYKFSLLKEARRIAVVKILRQQKFPVTAKQRQVLTPAGSPNGLQGLLHYFNLVEGCISMIKEYQTQNHIQYDWIVRTRVDGYWSAPLSPLVFSPGTYTVPSGSAWGGINDRFGVGDPNISRSALSRISLIPQIFQAGYRQLGSETAFKAQLVIKKVRFREIQLPFCILSDRRYGYPPEVPVASMATKGPLSGAKCRPCHPVCKGKCSINLFRKMDRRSNWIDGDPDLCDGHGAWEKGWERAFDRAAGEKYASARTRIGSMNLDQCMEDLNAMMSRAGVWDGPPASTICKLGLGANHTQ